MSELFTNATGNGSMIANPELFDSVIARPTIIYCLSDPRTNEIRYVGKTRYSIHYRLKAHMKDTRRQYKAKWIQSLIRAGVTPTIDTLEIAGDDWPECERFWIAYLRFLGCDLCNLSIGGEGGTLGAKFSEETKAKMRKKKHTEEWKQKMRDLNTGKKMPASAIAKMKSRVFTPVHRARLTESQLGNNKGAGHVMTETHKEILRRRFTGISLSESHRANLRAAWVIRKARNVC